MKPFERIPFLANVLIVACSRPKAEVGKLVKAVVTYVTEGTRTNLGQYKATEPWSGFAHIVAIE